MQAPGRGQAVPAAVEHQRVGVITDGKAVDSRRDNGVVAAVVLRPEHAVRPGDDAVQNGAPEGTGAQATSANLSVPERKRARASCGWRVRCS